MKHSKMSDEYCAQFRMNLCVMWNEIRHTSKRPASALLNYRYWNLILVKGVYRVLVGKPEGKRPLGRPRRRWEDNIRMDLEEVGLGYEDWIGLAQDRDRWRMLVSAVRNLRVP